MKAESIAIIGAGPAGATLARRLAEAGRPVTLFDHRAPWEKPCGGMLGHTTRRLEAELEGYPYPLATCSRIRCLSPAGRSKVVECADPIPVVSRRELGRFLLDRAREAGAQFVPRKVLALSRAGSQWRLQAGTRDYDVDLVVGADGARSLVRRYCLDPIPDGQLALICGYLGTGLPTDEYLFAFPDFEGFLYLVPRTGITGIGIGARVGALSGTELFNRIDRFIGERGGGFEVERRFAALLPMVRDPAFFAQRCSGENWLLVGDAAGHVDPLLGEGIVYAVGSAHCAAEALADGEIGAYEDIWRQRYGEVLQEGAAFRARLAELAAEGDPRLYGVMTYERI